ncbi:hypothetical protein MNBD_BACTEROID01-412 [hydrothermal vent metagenome]|uniref:Uncharacterized protein n=1 Tax=hydrothermal vent metagenome TaxID=652676 RepID=A0A3B0T8C3_9ZZZZ
MENLVIANEIFICSPTGHILDSIPKKGDLSSSTIFYRYLENLHYKGSFQDTLYNLSKDCTKNDA